MQLGNSNQAQPSLFIKKRIGRVNIVNINRDFYYEIWQIKLIYYI